MKALADSSSSAARIYLVGGASAVLLGWRSSTIDLDLKIVPENDEIFRALPKLKEQLHINIETAAPDDFIPELPGWRDRSQFIEQTGTLTFLHYDFYAQALAKIERGHDIDLKDVGEMINRNLVQPEHLVELFTAIEGHLYRYPAIDPAAFRGAVQRIIDSIT
jgi:hypothetical protein